MLKRIIWKKLAAVSVLFALAATFSCCLEPISLDSCGYVIAIGAEKGREKRYYFTLALQRELSEPASDEGGGASILACEGDDLDEAVNEIKSNIPYTLNFSRAVFIVLSRGLAEEGGLEDVFALSFDSFKIRLSTEVVVTECGVSSFIGGLSANNDANIKSIREALKHDMEKTGMVTLMPIIRLYEAANDGCFDFCAVLGDTDEDIVTDTEQKKAENEGKDPIGDVEPGDRAGGLKSFASGTALFSGMRMTGSLDRAETLFLNMACGDLNECSLTIPFRDGGEEGGVTLRLSMLGVKREVVRSEGGFTAREELRLAVGVHRKPQGVSKEKLDEWLETDAVPFIEEGLQNVFEKCRAAGSDAMRFGTEALRLLSPDQTLDDIGWRGSLNELEAEFEVSLINMDND